MEDHKGRYVLFLGQFGAQAAQRVEQDQILGQHGQAGTLAAAVALAGLGAFTAHHDLALALEDLAAAVGEAQAAVGFGVHFEQAGGHQLAEHAAPGAGVEVLADAVGAQFAVAELADLVVLAAAQDVDQVAHAEALAAAVDAAERFLGGHAGVPGVGRDEAVVAVAAGLGVDFAEPGQQHLAPALHGFAVAEQVVKLVAFEAFAFFAGLGLFDHLLEQHDVAQAVAEPGFGGFAVAAGTAGFLVIPFHGFGQVGVGDEADVGFVDAHAEGDGGAHDDAILAQEAALVGGAHFGGQAGVVGQGVEAFLAEELGGFLDFAP